MKCAQGLQGSNVFCGLDVTQIAPPINTLKKIFKGGSYYIYPRQRAVAQKQQTNGKNKRRETCVAVF